MARWRRAAPAHARHELLSGQGIDVGYTTLRRYAHEVLGWQERKPTVRVADSPYGDEAPIDFPLMGRGRPRRLRRDAKLCVLLVALRASRLLFVWPCYTQTTRDVIEGLEAAWRFFGGVPRHIVRRASLTPQSA